MAATIIPRNIYADIANFNANEDIIQLHGSPTDYRLATSPEDLPTGTAIYRNEGDSEESVAIVRDISSLNIIWRKATLVSSDTGLQNFGRHRVESKKRSPRLPRLQAIALFLTRRSGQAYTVWKFAPNRKTDRTYANRQLEIYI